MSIAIPSMGLTLQPETVPELIDWALKGSPAPAPDFLKKLTLVEYAKRFGCTWFIETGTYIGATTALMASVGLRVRSVEIAPALHESAKATLADIQNIELYLGDSSDLLPAMLDGVDGPALLWLDGHYSGGPTSHGETWTPILKELLHTFQWNRPDMVLMIDDIRIFGAGDYPSLEFVQSMIAHYMPRHEQQMFNDILRVTPRLG